MKIRVLHIIWISVFMMNCQTQKMDQVQIYETSASGNQLAVLQEAAAVENAIKLSINPDQKFQKILGFGGAFTESSAYLLGKLGKKNREDIINAYFSEEGANYSFTRTTMASCDFSRFHYTYAAVEGDENLQHFTIDPDRADLLPMIKQAKKASKEGFKIIASPWTSPPWMKDNNAWVGGKLLPKYREAYAKYFTKYLQEYQKEGIDIWGVTVVNEPHGNGNNWESMIFSPKEMTDFVEDFLGPRLETDGWKEVKILGYDQNRVGLPEWVDEMYRSEKSSKYFAGTAIHWYESTYDYFPKELDYAKSKAPNKYLIQTEACIDAEVPVWKDDAWYWKREATDWGWDWASEKDKYLHPKYVPVHRYAGDIIGCLNHHVEGWIDWNMVLNKQGGPNWFKNWCIAPVIVDEDKDEVYFTPLFYTMAHFSKFIRPNASRIGWELNSNEVQVTAAENPDGSIAVVLFNPSEHIRNIEIQVKNKMVRTKMSASAIQTIIIKKK